MASHESWKTTLTPSTERIAFLNAGLLHSFSSYFLRFQCRRLQALLWRTLILVVGLTRNHQLFQVKKEILCWLEVITKLEKKQYRNALMLPRKMTLRCLSCRYTSFVSLNCRILFVFHSCRSCLLTFIAPKHVSRFFFWASSSNHCLAAPDLGEGVEQRFDCLIVHNRQAVQSSGVASPKILRAPKCLISGG